MPMTCAPQPRRDSTRRAWKTAGPPCRRRCRRDARWPDARGRRGGQRRSDSQTGCAKPTCATMPLPKKVPIAIERAIDELIGQHQIERAHSSRRLPTALAEMIASTPRSLEAEDVGAEIQLRRHQPVALAVPGEKRDAMAAQRRRACTGRKARRTASSASCCVTIGRAPPCHTGRCRR